MEINPPIPAPKVDDSVYKLMYELGKNLIWDDRADIYRTVYAYRPRHKYHGKLSPHHPSPAHHYLIGSVLVLLAQFGVLANTAVEAQQLAKDMESEDFIE